MVFIERAKLNNRKNDENRKLIIFSSVQANFLFPPELAALSYRL